jgi:hypothetical protein
MMPSCLTFSMAASADGTPCRADLLDVVPLRAGERRAPHPTAARHVDP